ncbi:MAG: hypothetical protein KDK70_01470 [Myxococcales bacterium]|nr:hypothetical protein [Myxococcales bacterium]
MVLALGALGLGASSCSTKADPVEDEPPVCEFCEVGEQELKCAIATYLGAMFNSEIGDAAYVCLDPAASDEDKEQACRDSCEQYIAGNELGLVCAFKPGMEPFRWSSCVPPTEPTGGGAGAEHACPGWYAPSARVRDYEVLGPGLARVTIERGFVEDLREDVLALYVCDDARYVQRETGWVFEGLDAGDLLFALGLREGDRDAIVQGFDPRTMEATTEPFALDSIEEMAAAYDSLAESDGVRVMVERKGAGEGGWEVWVTVD